MGRDEENDSEWREAAFAEFVSAEDVQDRALALATRMRGESDPIVRAEDVTAARPYLRKCIQRMSTHEAYQLDAEHAAHLLARGALGAARYRMGGGGVHGRKGLRTER